MARKIKVSTTGYKKNSKDRHQPALMIPSNQITMEGVEHPVFGMDDTGHTQMMMPGGQYEFPGSVVYELPLKKKSGGPTASKAKEMLRDGTAHKKPLTGKQKHYFQAIAHGWQPTHQVGGVAYTRPQGVDPYFAQNFGASHNIPLLANAGYTAGRPKFVNPDGTPYVATPTKPLPMTVPNGLKLSDFYTVQGGAFGYDDPTTGDFKRVDPSIVNAPQFKTQLKKGGNWIQHAVNPKHKGYCTPMTKKTCTPRRKALARTFKKHHGFHQKGGEMVYMYENQNLPYLNNMNIILTKLSEGLRNREQQNYNRQMVELQNQPATYVPEGQYQYGDPMSYQIGGIVPEQIASAAPVFDTPQMTDYNASPRSSFNPASPLSANMVGYAAKADKFLSIKAPKSGVTGQMLASAAQQAYKQFGKVVPVELALAQLQVEGYIAPGSGNKPQRTRNPFNVGNTDSGATRTYNDVQSGINAYYNLIASSYLKNKTPEQLLQHFENFKGQRYATDPNYETKLNRAIPRGLKKGGKTYKQGGTYDISEEEIKALEAQGYIVERV